MFKEVNTLNTRIKELRKHLKMTTEVFGERIGIVSSAVTNIEAGRRNPTNQLVLSICREFNVNETWLRTGEGEMFVQLSRDEQIAKFVGDVMRSSDGDFKRSVILALSEMPDECWDVWADFVRKVAEKQKEKPPNE